MIYAAARSQGHTQWMLDHGQDERAYVLCRYIFLLEVADGPFHRGYGHTVRPALPLSTIQRRHLKEACKGT